MASLKQSFKIINLKSFLLKLIVFLSGALTMLFEIAGIRLFGAFLGASNNCLDKLNWDNYGRPGNRILAWR